MALFILELVNIDDNLVLEVILDILRCHGFDDRWLGLASFPGTIVLEVHLVKVDEVPPAQVVASVREGLGEEHRGRWKNLASNQAEAFLSAESQLIKFVSIEEALIMIITIISINLANNQAEAISFKL